MYGSLHTAPLSALADRDGFVRGYQLENVGGGPSATLSLWRDEQTARAATDHGQPVLEVISDWFGTAATDPPGAAALLHFDGPISPAGVAAARRAEQDRLIPAVRDLPGFVGTIVLWEHEARSTTVLSVAVDLAALAAAQQVIGSTELLPGEDPALLPGPDRADIHHVSAYVTVPIGAQS